MKIDAYQNVQGSTIQIDESARQENGLNEAVLEQASDSWETSESEFSPYVSYNESGSIAGSQDHLEVMNMDYWAHRLLIDDDPKELFMSFLRGESTLDQISANFKELSEKLQSIPRAEFPNAMSDDKYFITLNDRFAEGYAYALKCAVVEYNNDEACSKYGKMDRIEYAYLNAEYYYQCKDMLKTVSDAKKDIITEKGLDVNASRELICSVSPRDFILTNVSIFNDLGIEPPRDLKLFIKPSKYTEEELKQGTCYYLNWQTPPNGLCYGVGLPIMVPKGMSLLLSNSKLNYLLFPKLTLADDPKQPRGHFAKYEIAYDLSEYIGFDQSDSAFWNFMKFAQENFFNDNAGEITIEAGGRTYTKDIPFCLWTDQLSFNASEFCDTGSAESTQGDKEVSAFMNQFTIYGRGSFAKYQEDLKNRKDRLSMLNDAIPQS